MTKFTKQLKVLVNGQYLTEVKYAIYSEGGEKTMPDGSTKFTEDNIQLTLVVVDNMEPALNGLEVIKTLSLGSKSDVFTKDWWVHLTGKTVQELMSGEVGMDTDDFLGKRCMIKYSKVEGQYPVVELMSHQDQLIPREVPKTKEKKK